MENEIIKSKKRTRKRLTALERLHQDSNHPAPGHAAGLEIAAGYCDEMNQAHADETKSAAQMAAATGNPVAGYPDGSNRQENSRELAFRHADLRQSSTSLESVLARLSTVRGNLDQGLPAETPGGFQYAGSVVLRTMDAAARAGDMRDAAGNDVLSQVNYSPVRPDYHQARSSATADNGSHSSASQQGACSMAPVSMKASDRLQVMKDTMRRIG